MTEGKFLLRIYVSVGLLKGKQLGKKLNVECCCWKSGEKPDWDVWLE